MLRGLFTEKITSFKLQMYPGTCSYLEYIGESLSPSEIVQSRERNCYSCGEIGHTSHP